MSEYRVRVEYSLRYSLCEGSIFRPGWPSACPDRTVTPDGQRPRVDKHLRFRGKVETCLASGCYRRS